MWQLTIKDGVQNKSTEKCIPNKASQKKYIPKNHGQKRYMKTVYKRQRSKDADEIVCHMCDNIEMYKKDMFKAWVSDFGGSVFLVQF